MVSITNPRTASVLAILALVLMILAFQISGGLPLEIQLVMILLISSLIGIAAYNFAARELKETAGAGSSFELGFGRIFSIVLFALFLVMGYDIFMLSIIDMFDGVTIHPSINAAVVIMMILSVIYITVYPFFQILNLAREGEQSSLPSEFVIENIAEFLSDRLRSPFLAAVFLYLFFYGIPIFFISEVVLGQDILLSIFMWSLLLPLISVSALAGAGLGEDLIRLKMMRRPIRDLKRLGLPKLSLKPLKFETGGLLLVLLAFQALLTTLFFGITSIGVAFSVTEVGATTGVGLTTILITLLNKGRGATKEIKEVWTESGFKVSAFQLFLPVFVFLGVMLSSILEVFISNNPENIGALVYEIGVTDNNHIRLISIFLAVQNFFLIFTAIFIYRVTPGTAERRLIKELPQFYVKEDGTPDIEGYLYIYRKLKSDRSIENMLIELSKNIDKSISDVNLLKGILNESIDSGSERVQVAASNTLYLIMRKLREPDDDFTQIARKTINSKFSGARIYAVRTYRILISQVDGIEKEEMIKEVVEHLNDGNNVVAWDSGLLLQHIIIEDEKYRSYVLALVIKSLINTDKKSTINSITRFLRKISYDSQIIGKMAISTLGTYLQTESNIDNLVLGIRAILRGNQSLAMDLIDQVSMGTANPDEEQRKLAYVVLMNMADYSEGLDDEIIHLILAGIKDESEEIQELSYSALRNEVLHSSGTAEMVYGLIASNYTNLEGIALLGALDVIDAITESDLNIEDAIFNLIKSTADSNHDNVRAKVFKVFSTIVNKEPKLGQAVFKICEKSLDHNSEDVRQQAIMAMGRAVQAYPDLAKVVYRRVNKARNDTSFKTQLAAIEAMGYVAAANKKLSAEIFENLKPLLDDNNWQVRLASFNGLVAASKNRRDLYDDLVQQTIRALSDDDNQVRESGFDALVWLIPAHRASTEVFVTITSNLIKNVSEDVLASLYDALGFIADRRIQYLDRIISMLHHGFNAELSSTRYNALNTLKISVNKLAKARGPSRDIHKTLNRLITSLLKAANNSNTAVRSTAYDGIIEICVAVPHFKLATRGRKALRTALKNEKDVGLTEQLNKGIIRAKPPLEIEI